MSPSVVIGAVIAGFAAGSTAVAIGFSVGMFAASMALGLVSYAMQRQASRGDFSAQAKGYTQTFKDPSAARRVIYGQTRVGGVFYPLGSTDDDNFTHFMVLLAGHECDAITDIEFNGKPLSEFEQFGEVPVIRVDYRSATPITYDLTVNGTLYSDTDIDVVISALETAGYVSYGSGGTGAGEGDTSAYYGSIHVEGMLVTDSVVVTSTAGTVDVITTADGVGYRVNVHLGSPTQTADADAVAEIEEWTTAHRLQNIAYLYVRLRFDRAAYPTGIPNVTALVRGKNDIYDPRDASTGYKNNSALCLANYFSDTHFGMSATVTTAIDQADLIEAANVCDDAMVALTGEAGVYRSEPRYTCNGVIETSEQPQAIIQSILSSMAGSSVYTGGVWHIQAGAYQLPTIGFDESDLIDGFTVQTSLTRAETCNAVKGVYVGPDNRYQPGDFPAVTNATYQTQDGERIWKDIDLKFTNSSSMAQRLAKIELERTRQAIALKVRCNLSALAVKAGDNIYFSNTRLGFASKVFTVSEWGFVNNTDGTLAIDMTLRETAPGVWDWNSGEETLADLAPNTQLPSPWIVQPPTALILTESARYNSDGSLLVDVIASWTGSTSRNVAHYEVQGQHYLAADWLTLMTTELSQAFPGNRGNTSYNCRVRAVSHFGARSAWIQKSMYADGITEAPLAPTTLSTLATVDTVTALWTNNADQNTLLGTEIWATTTEQGNDRSLAGLVTVATGQRYSVAVPSGSGFYIWIRAIDKTGSVSTWIPVSPTSGEHVVAASGGLTAQQVIDVDNAATMIADIALDGKFDISEKRQWHSTIDDVGAHYTATMERADVLGLTAADPLYSSAVNDGRALADYLVVTADWDNFTASSTLITYADAAAWAAVGSTATPAFPASFASLWDDYLRSILLVDNEISLRDSQRANVEAADVTTISAPLGATYGATGAVSGAIVVALPQGWSSSTVKFEVDVFIASASQSFKAIVGGYSTGASSAWADTFAQIIGYIGGSNRVRFGMNAGSKVCVVIGETTDSRTSPKISVSNLQVAGSNRNLEAWQSGWSVSFVTDLTGYTLDASTDYADALLDAQSIANQGDLATQDRTALDYEDGADVTAASEVITQLASDNWLTKAEKLTHRPNWEAIILQKPPLVAQASSLSVSSTSYVAAYNALYTYMTTTANINTAVDTPIVGSTFRSKWADYFAAWQSLSNALAAKAATVANWTSVASRPTNLAGLNSTEGTKLTGIAVGATVGATAQQVTDISSASSSANLAYNLAGTKKRVFPQGTTPAPPYDIGDLWDSGIAAGLKRCTTARASGQSSSSYDWTAVPVDALNVMKDGTTIISGTYIRAGLVSADNIKVGTLTGRVIQSAFSAPQAIMYASGGSNPHQILMFYAGGGIGVQMTTNGNLFVSSINAGTAITGHGGDIGVYGTGTDVGGKFDGSASGHDVYLASSAAYAFTGAHEGIIHNSHDAVSGDILVDDKMLDEGGDIFNTIAFQALSSLQKQKAVIGIYTSCHEITSDPYWDGERYEVANPDEVGERVIKKGSNKKLKRHITDCTSASELKALLSMSTIPSGFDIRGEIDEPGWQRYKTKFLDIITDYRRCNLNALGEGRMNVCPEGGNLEAGDYICSSSTPGKGMKQDDDLLHNYTVAKSREDVAWTAQEVTDNVVKMIACTYHCG